MEDPLPQHSRSPIGQHHASARRRRRRDAGYAEAAQEVAPHEALARIVIRYRMARGLRQEDLAELMGTSHGAISRLGSGQHRPSVETLQKLARAFGRALVIGFADGEEGAGVDSGVSEPIVATVADRRADLITLA